MKRDIRRKVKKVIIPLGIIIFVCLFGIGGVYFYIRNSIYGKTPDLYGLNSQNSNSMIDENCDEFVIIDDLSKESKDNNEEILYKEQKGITNILLIGTDARDINENARSDSIIIATIDDNTKKLKLTSILRDTYVSIPKYSQQKINGAFALGGPELLMATIEKNFKLKLDKYVIVNFWGFEDIVDALGGIDIEVKRYEIDEINKYVGEFRERKSKLLINDGVQHLDGQQTLAYSRIRKVGNGVYERSRRQRLVLTILAQKLKDIKILQYPAILTKLLPCIKTNIEPISFLNYAYTISKFKPLEIKQLQIPMTELSEGRIYRGAWVFLMDKEQNSKILNDFIYKDKTPDISEIDFKSFKIIIDEYLRMGLLP